MLPDGANGFSISDSFNANEYNKTYGIDTSSLEKYANEFTIDINEEHFWEVVDTWRASHLWNKVDGKWSLLHPIK